MKNNITERIAIMKKSRLTFTVPDDYRKIMSKIEVPSKERFNGVRNAWMDHAEYRNEPALLTIMKFKGIWRFRVWLPEDPVWLITFEGRGCDPETAIGRLRDSMKNDTYQLVLKKVKVDECINCDWRPEWKGGKK